MKHILCILSILALTACGGSSTPTTSTLSVFKLWAHPGTESWDWSNAHFGGVSSVRYPYSSSASPTCDCAVQFQGTNEAGTITLPAPGNTCVLSDGSNDVICNNISAVGGGGGSYTLNGNTLHFCWSTSLPSSCYDYN